MFGYVCTDYVCMYILISQQYKKDSTITFLINIFSHLVMLVSEWKKRYHFVLLCYGIFHPWSFYFLLLPELGKIILWYRKSKYHNKTEHFFSISDYYITWLMHRNKKRLNAAQKPDRKNILAPQLTSDKVKWRANCNSPLQH